MNRLVAVLLLVLPTAGCAQAPPPPERYLVDAENEAPARYDIVRANFTELNGSLVLWIELRNFAEGLPLLEARIPAKDGATHAEVYVRLRADPGRRTLPQATAEVGRMMGDAYGTPNETCWIPSQPADPRERPWFLVFDLLHNMTGFDGGATITSLRLSTSDPNGSQMDEASHDERFHVEGRANPYAENGPPASWCPLLNEGRRLGF